MEFPPERSRPLHNFTLPTLRWGYQRHFRCMKINDTQQSNSSNPGCETTAPPTHKRSFVPKSPASSNDCERIEAIREKVMSDLRVAADRMKVSMFEENEKKQQLTDDPAGGNANVNEPNSNSASIRPCNLRTRRAACKEPPPVGPVVDSPRRANGCNNPSNKPPEIPAVTPKSTRLRGLTAAANTARQKSLERGDSSQRPKFSIPLAREEIESDFSLMTGKKPPRRPKKRTRHIQKQVDACFPGLWLSEVTPDLYKVPISPDSGKYFMWIKNGAM